jgi:hypothetical protein
MSIHPSKLIKNDYKYFKAVIGVLSKEFDYLGRQKEVLSLSKVSQITKGNKPVADYIMIDKNKTTECLFEIARQGLINQAISFYGKILDYKEVQLYDGMSLLQNKSYCKIGYIKNLRIGFEKKGKK